MRPILVAGALAVVAGALAGSAGPADAARRRAEVCDYRSGTYACYPADRKSRRQDDESDEIRANQVDPAGDYKGMPAWARRALSPRYDGGFR